MRPHRFFRKDFGEASVGAQISYSNSAGVDGDIIHTENDSVVLLYRANSHDAWHILSCPIEGNWKVGRFNLSEAPSGYYTIGVVDKTMWSVNQTSTQLLNIYPIPTDGFITVETEPADYRITNLTGQTLMTGRVETQRIDVSKLPAGTYFIIINGIAKKIIVL